MKEKWFCIKHEKAVHGLWGGREWTISRPHTLLPHTLVRLGAVYIEVEVVKMIDYDLLKMLVDHLLQRVPLVRWETFGDDVCFRWSLFLLIHQLIRLSRLCLFFFYHILQKVEFDCQGPGASVDEMFVLGKRGRRWMVQDPFPGRLYCINKCQMVTRMMERGNTALHVHSCRPYTTHGPKIHLTTLIL